MGSNACEGAVSRGVVYHELQPNTGISELNVISSPKPRRYSKSLIRHAFKARGEGGGEGSPTLAHMGVFENRGP